MGSLGFFDSWRAEDIGFPDGVDMGGLSFLDSCGAEGLSILGSTGTDSSGFLDGFHCLRIISMKLYPQLQTIFHLWALVDDLVASSLPRAFLAFSQRWLASVGGVLQLGPGVLAYGRDCGGDFL